MPKEVIVVDKFYGGEDSNTDPRDITMESSAKMVNLESIDNLETDKKGKLSLSGKFVSTGISRDIGVSAGSDWDNNPVTGGTPLMVDYGQQSTFLYASDYSFLYQQDTEDAQFSGSANVIRPCIIIPTVIGGSR